MPVTDYARGSFYPLALGDDPTITMGETNGGRLVLKSNHGIQVADVVQAVRTGSVRDFCRESEVSATEVGAVMEAVERLLRA